MTGTHESRHKPGLLALRQSHGTALTWAARGLGAFALVVFGVLIIREGVPRSVELEDWEILAQLVALAMAIVAYALAWRWDGLGGALLVAAAIVLGILASIQYTPPIALFAALGFFIPGALFLVHWQQHHRPVFLFAVAGLLIAFLAAGAVGSHRLYDSIYGSTHSPSTAELPRKDIIEWAWSGAPTTGGFEVRAKLSEDADGAILLVSESAELTDAKMFGGEVSRDAGKPVFRFVAKGLTPDTVYHYAVQVRGRADQGRRGTVRTFPEAPSSFRFVLGSCIMTGSNGSVFDRMREESPLFFLVTGDFQYENIDTNDPWAFRQAYDRNLGSIAQESLYLSTPVMYTWDDHDFGGDGSDRTSESQPAAAMVYRETVPHYDFAANDGGIYHAFTAGRVRFIVTDGRTYRDPAAGEDGPGKSLLGTEQKAWLKKEMLAAKDAGLVIAWVNAVPWISANTGGDDWGAYATERAELANFIAENRIERLFMLSGDAHMLGIDDGTHSNYATAPGEAGFPVFHAAALDRPGSVKGGPYSEGAYPGGGQYGVVDIEDDGTRMTVHWAGKDYTGQVVVEYEFTVQ